MKIGIVITMCNQVAYSKACVESIVTKYPYELILVDDYSIDGTKAWTHSLPWATLIEDPDTDSLGAKWNLGAAKAKELGCAAVLICNNDIIFNPATIDNIVSRLEFAMENEENVAIVSAHNRRGDTKPNEIKDLKVPKLPTESESPDFSCFLLDLTKWDLVGGFSEQYKPCYFEDNDFHMRLAKNKLKALCTTAAPYYHYGSITQNSVKDGMCKGPQFDYNKSLFAGTWGCIPGTQAYDEKVKGRF